MIVAGYNILRFIFLVLLQVLVLNGIGLGGYINPYVYVLIILALPVETPKWATLLIGFATGLCIDLFTRTMGMHITASIFLAYIRIVVLQFMAPREGYEVGSSPSIRDMSLAWFMTYAGILIIMHHLFLFFVEAFTVDQFWYTLSKALLSSVITFILVILFQFLGSQPKRSIN
tara:strand:+ start:643 stop:1161 length:519 start_codon:yes stop_codon:yes gene_type:complete